MSNRITTIIARTAAAFGLLGAISAPAQAQLSFGEATLFNDGWKFTLSPDSVAPSRADFDDSQWRELSLPHDWSVESYPSPTLNACTGYFPGGIGWYRKHFTADSSAPVRYIYFEGVYNRSEVYLNGHLLGRRPNGYVSHYYDMTPYLRTDGGENVLAVRVDHSREADSRWYTGSGIYRDVYMVSAGTTRLAPWGVGWKATSIRPSKAVMAVDFETVAPEGDASRLEIRASLADASGKVVARGSRQVKGSAKGELSLSVSRPQLWNLDSPYLYILRVDLYKDGKRIDGTDCRAGFRTLEFSPDKGFALNGRNMKVKGVCLHHDAGVLGAVVPEAVWRRRLQNLKAIGTNAIRMSHNPQAPVVYDLCDELGLLVMDEASDEWEFPKRKWIEGWNVGTPQFQGSYDFFEEWIDRDVADMVRRDRNHTCVAFWSIGNEVDYPNDPYSHPILDNARINQQNFGGYNPDAPSAMRIGEIAKRLAAIVRGIDSSRPVTGALAGVVMSNETAYPEAVDIVGYNYTEDRYHTDHELYPARVIYGSENGHGYREWLAVRDNDHIFGQFIWTGTDYLGEAGRWPSRGLGTGLLDFGSFAKPRGKFRASLWCDTPVAYLGTYEVAANWGMSIDAPAVWNYDEGTPVRVVCYTNAAQARLLLNGSQVADIKPRDDSNGIIAWDIPFKAGTLEVEALDADGKVTATDRIVTTGLPSALRASIDADESGLAHVLLEVVDAAGNTVPLADNMISCRVEGNARLLGLEGTSNHDMSHPKATERRASSGRVLAYVQRGDGGGKATVHFSSPLLKSTSIEL